MSHERGQPRAAPGYVSITSSVKAKRAAGPGRCRILGRICRAIFRPVRKHRKQRAAGHIARGGARLQAPPSRRRQRRNAAGCGRSEVSLRRDTQPRGRICRPRVSPRASAWRPPPHSSSPVSVDVAGTGGHQFLQGRRGRMGRLRGPRRLSAVAAPSAPAPARLRLDGYQEP